MTYQYDYFFSYRRDPRSDHWHRQVRDTIDFYLREELGQNTLSVFFDTSEITTGLTIKDKVAESAKRSKCLICIWSPRYFQSKWCLSEWRTFSEREKLFNCNLVVAASYHDGLSFPPEAQAKQFMDFSKYASLYKTFWKTTKAVAFEPLLKKFAKDTARIVRAAPPYNDSFPFAEVSDEDLPPTPPIGRPADA